MSQVFGTFSNDSVTINQYKYPYELYKSEVRNHEKSIHEYASDIVLAMQTALEAARPNFRLYENQPYINSVVRFKLVDFLLKMSVRLKIMPFVFYRAVRIFDRYCLKRIVVFDRAQLIITTCLWIAAKLNGGNNHFTNLTSDRNNNSVRTILDLGYGAGARFKGPTERYRFPKLSELIKLCGSRCTYDADMFKQMEVHILATLDWSFSDPGIEEYIVYSHEFKVTADEALETKLSEFFKIKQFVAYAACYLYELVKYDTLELAKILIHLVNDTLQLEERDPRFQTLNHSIIIDDSTILLDFRHAREIHRLLIRAVVNAPPYLLQCFDSSGPQLMYSLLTANYRAATDASCASSLSLASSANSIFSNYTYSPTPSCTTPTDCISDYYKPEPRLENFSRDRSHLLRTPVEMAHIHSHHYSLLQPPALALYARNNGSQASIRSLVSSKEHDIFDESGKYGLATPMSSDEECKSLLQGKRRAY